MKKLKTLILPIVIIAVLLLSATLFISLRKDVYYTVTFYSDETVYQTQEIQKGETVKKPTNPKKDGYLFIGWYLGDEVYDFSFQVNSNLKLVAKWDKSPVFYTVLFLDYDGFPFKNEIVEENQKVYKPENPQKRGYEFLYWSLGGKEYDFSLPIKSDLVLTSVWKETEKQTYTVTFDSRGGSLVSEQTVEYGKTALEPNSPSKDDYVFDGWLLNGKKFNFDTLITKDINLVASWVEKVVCTVNFYSDGQIIFTTKIDKGKPVQSFIPDNLQDKDFVCWLNGEIEYDFSLPVVTNLDLVAKWKDKEKTKFTVYFDSNNGETVFSYQVEENGVVIKPTTPIKQGYLFNGWKLNGNDYDFSSPVQESFTLVADWIEKESPTNFLGRWTGVEIFDWDEYLIELVVSENDNHKLRATDALLIFVVDYTVNEIFVAEEKLYVEIEYNGVVNLLIFNCVGEELFTDRGVLSGELTLNKND
ncbi:MAG: InlB B-repeat-containing protein [Clostridia bacterium]|nr:InlB B-repeat-containing protein [Clostridia bacterium]